ncbi:hypothetical protein [Winogradskyella costae]|uniref:hypothetical protein n=1 Tax=Winogradskyella costae TaxID=2697008 RepID=UPI0015CC1BBB|nr:hypothetical protein [Winogradskyella costae]
MKKYFLHFVLLIMILTITLNCVSTSKLYRFENEERNYAGQLNDSDFFQLKQFLTNSIASKLKDTIIIKYDYNNETCWNLLDNKNKDYIMDFVKNYNERVQNELFTRPNISIYNFREPGNNFNKIKKWNNNIYIDSTKQLFNLLFKERCVCGSSIAIMPDKKFVFIRSDSHSEILDLTQEQIKKIMNRK